MTLPRMSCSIVPTELVSCRDWPTAMTGFSLVPRASNAFAKPSVQGNQRVCNGMHCECDPILHSNLAHQLGYVRLDRALPDAQWGTDLLVRSPFHQHLQNLRLAVRKDYLVGWKDTSGRIANAFNEHRKYSPWNPDRTSADDPYRLHEISRRCSRIHVALGPLRDGLENGLFVHAGASHDDAQLWTWRFQAAHHIEQVVAVAQKHQINVLLRTDVRQ